MRGSSRMPLGAPAVSPLSAPSRFAAILGEKHGCELFGRMTDPADKLANNA
jgi:hypothetical protein